MENALIFDIQRFSLHDGPGIRTLVFFKGCSLACKWCSNPEGISFEPELRQNSMKCIGCSKCLKICPFGAISAGLNGMEIDRELCQNCGTCVEACGTEALTIWGKEYTVQELYDIILRDKPFYESSGGGVTLGGGDPVLQNKQAVALLKLCKKNGVNTAIETAGNYPWEYLEKAAPHCDTIHFDIKSWRKETSVDCVGVENKRIFENLKKLNDLCNRRETKPNIIVRIPTIPDYNFTTQDFEELGEYLKKMTEISSIEILPFHNLGENKYKQLGKSYEFEGSGNLKRDDVEEYMQIFKKIGLPVKVTTF